MEQEGQIHVPVELQEKTLRQLNEMDPYTFAVSSHCSSGQMHFLILSLFYLILCYVL